MHLFLLGLSHHTAPVELRERVEFSGPQLQEALATLVQLAGIAEAAVLSTCNRMELYLVAEEVERARRDALTFLTTFHRLPAEALRDHLYGRAGADAAQHLFRVAAGLDSLVVGEPQILGQVKDAYAAASGLQATGALLNRLFHWSFQVGKRVRAETGLAEGAVSVSYAAVSLARKIFGDLQNLAVLVVGAGEMAKLTATHLHAQSVRRIAITSRTPGHAQALADAVSGAVVPWDLLHAALADADIVITATGAPVPVIGRAHVQRATAGRRRPLFLIDIALPRDVEPAAGDLEQVFLYNIDDLRAIVAENLKRRAGEVERAEGIVLEEVRRFEAWLRSREALPTVIALRQRFDAIRRAELQRLEPKLTALPPEARARVEEITRLVVEKLLHTPTEQLKAIPDQETVLAYSDALSRLFSLTGDDAPQTVDDDELAGQREKEKGKSEKVKG
jgi:glutamyl-tRNA reductase